MQLDELRLPDHDWQAALTAAANNGDERPTWAYDWPAGKRLCQTLPQIMNCSGRRLCDLGCGRGLLGLQALLHDATSVCFADGSDHVLQWINAVLQANNLQDRAQCAVHRWGDPIPGGPYDCILGGDILYRPECFAELLNSIATSLTTDGSAFLADPRTKLESELSDLAATAGLTWQSERHDNGFTLVQCRMA